MERTNDVYLRLLGAVAGPGPSRAALRDETGTPVAPESCSCRLAGDERSLAHAVDDFKRRLVLRALERAGGNQTRAAAALGMHQSNLSRLMKTLDLR
ncbi:MAG: hypothetical protein HRU01_02480 [Myxococcales bacterium]|nr:hypothetical protein [Myxococcales bacterium]